MREDLRDKLAWWMLYGQSVSDFYSSWHFEFSAMKKAHELKTGKKMINKSQQVEKESMINTVAAIFGEIKKDGRR